MIRGLAFLLLAVAISAAIGWLVFWLGDRQIASLQREQRRCMLRRLGRYTEEGRKDGSTNG